MLEFVRTSAIELWETDGFALGLLAGIVIMTPVAAISYWRGNRNALHGILANVERSLARRTP